MGNVSTVPFGSMDEDEVEYYNDQIEHFSCNILIPVSCTFYYFVQ